MLLDTAVRSFKQRRRSMVRNIRANGWTYPFLRVVEAIRAATNNAVNGTAVSRAEVSQVLRQAFPEKSFSLVELAGSTACRSSRLGI